MSEFDFSPGAMLPLQNHAEARQLLPAGGPAEGDRIARHLLEFKTGREPQTTQWIRLASLLVSQSFSCDIVVRALSTAEKVANGLTPLDKLSVAIARKTGAKFCHGRLQRAATTNQFEGFLNDPNQAGAKAETYTFDKSFLPQTARVLVVGDVDTAPSTVEAITEAIRGVLPRAEVKFFSLLWVGEHLKGSRIDEKYFTSTASPLSVLAPASVSRLPVAKSPAVSLVDPAERPPGSAELSSGTSQSTSETAGQVPGTSEQSPGIASRSSGTAGQVPGTSEQSPGIASRSSGTAGQPPGVARQTPESAIQLLSSSEKKKPVGSRKETRVESATRPLGSRKEPARIVTPQVLARLPQKSPTVWSAMALVMVGVSVVLLSSLIVMFARRSGEPLDPVPPPMPTVQEASLVSTPVKPPVPEPRPAVAEKRVVEGPTGIITVPIAGLRLDHSLNAKFTRTSVKSKDRVTILKRHSSGAGPSWVQVQTRSGSRGWLWASIVREQGKGPRSQASRSR